MHPFASRVDDTVSRRGEEGLIHAIRGWLGDTCPPPPAGIGDDCAVMPAGRGRGLVTVDPVILGRHFDASLSPRAVGAKLLKRNLSDIAAMGGRPTRAVVALTLDPHVSWTWLRGFYQGLAACARTYGVTVVGGDVAQAKGVLAAHLTLLGEASAGRAVTRAGARVGDLLYVTGTLGRSVRSGHHHRFKPRLAEGSWLARHTAVRAMMDVSDGLAKDARALTPPNARAALVAATLPRRRGADLRAALSEGEDYELLFALDRRADTAAFATTWRRAFPCTRLTCIGRIAPRGEPGPGEIDLGKFHGYEHLRAG